MQRKIIDIMGLKAVIVLFATQNTLNFTLFFFLDAIVCAILFSQRILLFIRFLHCCNLT